MKPSKPNFLIVGSAKCGTTALDSILESHPDCCMGRPKEVCFFQDSMDFKSNPNYEKGWSWYREAFKHYRGEAMVGETTPSYSDRSRSPLTARRVYEFNPNMKIIYMVRDPLERQLSSWQMQFYEGVTGAWPDRRETKWALEGFCQWLMRQREVNQWDECRYAYQLQAYRDFFPEKDILVSFLEDWVIDKYQEVCRVMSFLGLSPSKWDPEGKERANKGSERTIERPMVQSLRNMRLLKTISKRLPPALSGFLKSKVSRKPVSLPEFDRASPVIGEFEEFIRKDILTAEPFRTKGMKLWKVKENC